MKNINIRLLLYIITLLSFILLSSCDGGMDSDLEKPEIDLSSSGAFPLNCDTLFFGEAFEVKMIFRDNMELGAYNISIHHNFDHHNHSTEITQCEMDAEKVPVNPYIFIQDYEIAAGLLEHEVSVWLTIPISNQEGAFDPGDYHFFINLTDQSGWSTQKGLSVKILGRNN